MENVRDIAKWFLARESMTHKKIQKLCYYAQAWHCALFNEELFEDDIQAWVHGPVIPTLYPIYTDYKWNPIPQKDFNDDHLCDNAITILMSVYNSYGDFTGDQLERMTHQEDPWRITRGDLKPWETCTKVIPVELMRDYYAKLYEQSQND